MSPSASKPLGIIAAPQEHWAEALQLLRRDVDAEVAGPPLANLLARARTSPELMRFLWTAWRGDELVGVTWIEPLAGGAAVLASPRLVAGESADTADELLREVLQAADLGGLRLLQAIIERDSGPDAERLRAAGFQHATELLHLVARSAAFPQSNPSPRLTFEPCTSPADPRLARMVERTYVGSLDCPQVHDTRGTEQMLAGYRDVGVFDPARWLNVRRANQDVGCLLLTDHPESDQWELLYMGVVPDARGHGYGVDMARYGLWLAGQAHRDRVTLAVDAANHFALATYAAAGFAAWDRRSLFLRHLGAVGQS